MKKLIKKSKEKKGFTLVEVIVVLVILAILAAIMIPSMVGWINKAQDKTAIVEARTVLLAAQTEVSDNYSDYSGSTVTTLGNAVEQSIFELSGIKQGATNGNIVSWTVENCQVTNMVYTSTDGVSVTYNGTDFTVND